MRALVLALFLQPVPDPDLPVWQRALDAAVAGDVIGTITAGGAGREALRVVRCWREADQIRCYRSTQTRTAQHLTVVHAEPATYEPTTPLADILAAARAWAEAPAPD